MVRFAIKLNEKRHHWYAGETIRGHVSYGKAKPLTIRYLRIAFVGVESIVEPTRKKKRKGSITKSNVKRVKVLERVRYLIGDPSNPLYSKRLPGGEHTFPFEIQLPMGIPSTCGHPKGIFRLRYTLSAHLEVPGYPNSQASQEVFVLADPTPVARPQTLFAQTKSVSSKPIKTECTLLRHAMFPGDVMAIHLKIENKALLPISKFSVDIRQIWAAGNLRDNLAFSHADYMMSQFSPTPVSIFELPINVQIPTDINPTIDTAKTISVRYFLVVTVFVRRSPELTLNCPLLIIPRPPPTKAAPAPTVVHVHHHHYHNNNIVQQPPQVVQAPNANPQAYVNPQMPKAYAQPHQQGLGSAPLPIQHSPSAPPMTYEDIGMDANRKAKEISVSDVDFVVV